MKASGAAQSRAGFELPRKFLVLAPGMATAALAVVALRGWVLKLPLLASFGTDLIPMAPSTAVLFLLFGAAACLRVRTPLRPWAYSLSAAMVALGTLVALLLFTLGCLDIHWTAEHLGLNIPQTVGAMPAGHMSPVTAFCFLLAGASSLASLSRSAIRPWRAALAAGTAGVLLAVCFIFLLAYLYGKPLLYSGQFIPPALNTIFAFTFLSIALLTPIEWPVGLFRPTPEGGSATALLFALAFILLTAGIVVTGYHNYRKYAQDYRANVEYQLTAIADLKMIELLQWRKERLADGAILFRNAAFVALTRQFFANPADPDAQCQLLDWMGKLAQNYEYDRVWLLDTQRVTRLAVPAESRPSAAETLQRVSAVLQLGQPTFQDFYRNEHDQHIYLAVLVPILDETAANQPLGVLVMRIDPTPYLYPFIKRWPTPSLTAETLLVRREDNDVVFLNNLRFRETSALNLRVPMIHVTLPAVQAVLGREGLMEGQDYRNVPVLSVLRSIPNSPWFIVAKIDTAELYAPMQEQLWHTVVLFGALILGVGVCVGLAWWQQRVWVYQKQQASAEALTASELRYRRLFEAARDGILILDAKTGMVVDVNPYLVELLGVTREVFLGKKVWELGFFHDRITNEANFAELQEKGYVRYEDMALEGHDGKRHEVEFISNVYLVNHRKVIQCNIRDISERKQAEAALQASEATFKAVAELSPLAIYASTGSDQRALFINRAFYEIFGFSLADTPTVGHWWIKAFPDAKYRQEVMDQWVHNIEQAKIENTNVKELECVCTCKDGSEKIIIWVGKAMGDEFWAFGYDLTERKRAEGQIRIKAEQLAKSNEELTRLNRLMTGRELRVIELKQQVNDLAAQLGQSRLYPLAFLDAAATEVVRTTPKPGGQDAGSRESPKGTAP